MIEVEWLGRIGYTTALDLQDRLAADVLAGRSPEKLLLLEHEPVYTIGRTRDRSSLRAAEFLPYPVMETNRGGQATWHGPGQLVAYPILNLDGRGRDLHLYIRFLEKVIIDTCAQSGVPAHQREGLTGVWVAERKLASIGVGVRKWISMHGLALNVTDESLEAFEHITPCGIADVTMTSLEKETGRSFRVEETGRALAEIFQRKLPELSRK